MSMICGIPECFRWVQGRRVRARRVNRGSVLNRKGKQAGRRGAYSLGSIRNGLPSLSVKFNFVDLDASSSTSALEAVSDSPLAVTVDKADDVDPDAVVFVDLNRAAKRA